MEFLIFFIPIALLLLAKYWLPKSITFFEVGVGIILISLTAYLVYHFNIFDKIMDEEVWNGQVIEKVKSNVSCGHSYDCYCTRSSNSPTDNCSTCYQHAHDVDWKLTSTIGDIKIPRVDSQGLIPPPTWLEAYESEPVSRINLYENYIQGAESSLFNESTFKVEQRFKHLIPTYPIKVYNTYHFDHAISIAVTVPDIEKWNSLLAESLKELGPKKQVNVLLVIVNTQDASYIHSLETSWLRGNKNDVVVVVGSTDYPKMAWVDVMSWSPAELFKVQLRDDIAAVGVLNPEIIVPIIERHISKSFVRMEMSKFSHLKNEINLSKELIYWLLGMLVIGSFIFALLAHKYEIHRLFIKISGVAAFILFAYLVTMINFFVIFLGFPIAVLGWVIWSNYDSKRKKLKANEHSINGQVSSAPDSAQIPIKNDDES